MEDGRTTLMTEAGLLRGCSRNTSFNLKSTSDPSNLVISRIQYTNTTQTGRYLYIFFCFLLFSFVFFCFLFFSFLFFSFLFFSFLFFSFLVFSVSFFSSCYRFILVLIGHRYRYYRTNTTGHNTLTFNGKTNQIVSLTNLDPPLFFFFLFSFFLFFNLICKR